MKDDGRAAWTAANGAKHGPALLLGRACRHRHQVDGKIGVDVSPCPPAAPVGVLSLWAAGYWSEVDFVFWRGDHVVAIEVKHGSRYRREYRRGIAALLGQLQAESHVVYGGDRLLEVEGTHVLPVEAFLRRMHGGEVLR